MSLRKAELLLSFFARSLWIDPLRSREPEKIAAAFPIMLGIKAATWPYLRQTDAYHHPNLVLHQHFRSKHKAQFPETALCNEGS
jgi:hypothetical protein